MTQTNIKRIFFYGLLLSSIIGMGAFSFIAIETTLTNWLWFDIPKSFKPVGNLFYLLALPLIGAIILIKISSQEEAIPKTAHLVLKQVKDGKKLNYQSIKTNILAALTILVFGAGVGPKPLY